jgi:hypothetical protein
MKFLVEELRNRPGHSFIIKDKYCIVIHHEENNRTVTLDLPFIYFRENSPAPMFWPEAPTQNNFVETMNKNTPSGEKFHMNAFYSSLHTTKEITEDTLRHYIVEFQIEMDQLKEDMNLTPEQAYEHLLRSIYMYARLHNTDTKNHSGTSFALYDLQKKGENLSSLYEMARVSLCKQFRFFTSKSEMVIPELSMDSIVRRFLIYYSKCYGYTPGKYSVLRFLKSLELPNRTKIEDIPDEVVLGTFNSSIELDKNILLAAFCPIKYQNLDNVLIYDDYEEKRRRDSDGDTVMSDSEKERKRNNDIELKEFGFTYEDIEKEILVQSSFFKNSTTIAILKLILKRPYPIPKIKFGVVEIMGQSYKVPYCRAYFNYQYMVKNRNLIQDDTDLLNMYCKLIFDLPESYKNRVDVYIKVFLYLKWKYGTSNNFHENRDDVMGKGDWCGKLKKERGVYDLVKKYEEYLLMKQNRFKRDTINMNWFDLFRSHHTEDFIVNFFVPGEMLWILTMNVFYPVPNKKSVRETVKFMSNTSFRKRFKGLSKSGRNVNYYISERNKLYRMLNL